MLTALAFLLPFTSVVNSFPSTGTLARLCVTFSFPVGATASAALPSGLNEGRRVQEEREEPGRADAQSITPTLQAPPALPPFPPSSLTGVHDGDSLASAILGALQSGRNISVGVLEQTSMALSRTLSLTPPVGTAGLTVELYGEGPGVSITLDSQWQTRLIRVSSGVLLVLRDLTLYGRGQAVTGQRPKALADHDAVVMCPAAACVRAITSRPHSASRSWLWVAPPRRGASHWRSATPPTTNRVPANVVRELPSLHAESSSPLPRRTRQRLLHER